MVLFRKILITIQLLACCIPIFAQYERLFTIPFPEQMRLLDSVFISAAKKDSATLYGEFAKARAAASNANAYTRLNLERAILSVKTDEGYEQSFADKNGRIIIRQAFEMDAPEIAGVQYMTLGFFYELQQQDFGKAFENYLKGYDIFEKLPENKLPPKQYGLYKVGLAYYHYGDYENALRLSLRTNRSFAEKTSVYVFNVDLIGMCYMKMGQYDSARWYFNVVLDHANLMASQAAWKGIALGNIGTSYLLQNNEDEAVAYLMQAVPLTFEGKVFDNTAGFASRLSGIFLKKGNKAESKKYLDIALDAARRANVTEEYYTVYNAAAAYYRALGQSQFTLAYSDSASYLNTELLARKNLNIKYQVEMARQNELMQEREKLIVKEKQRQVLLRNAAIAGILMLMIISLLVYNRAVLKNRSRQQILMAEKQLAETELSSATIRLDNFTHSIKEKNELIEKAAAEIERVNTELLLAKNLQPGDSTTTDMPHSLRQLQESVLLTDDAWKEFTVLFEKVYSGFFFRLKEKFAGLSPAETRYMALAKLNLTNKEMAAMLGVGTDAIRQMRSRLKRKLNLQTDDAIEEIAAKI